MDTPEKKETTLEDLATMVAGGFADIAGRMATQDDIAAIRAEMATKDDIAGLKIEIEGLRNSVNNYLRLSDERYLELKHRQDVIVKWVAQLAKQNNIALDLNELQYK